MSSVSLTIIVFSLLNSESPCMPSPSTNTFLCSVFDCQSSCLDSAVSIDWKLGSGIASSLEKEVLCELQASLEKPLALCELSENPNNEVISLHNSEIVREHSQNPDSALYRSEIVVSIENNQGLVYIKDHKLMNDKPIKPVDLNVLNAPSTVSMLETSTGILPPIKVAFYHPLKDEYLYAGTKQLDSQRRYVLSWIPKDNEGRPSNDVTTHWQLYFYGSYVGIKNVATAEWMFAGVSKLDYYRRYALTWIGSGTPEDEDTMRWVIDDNSLFTCIRSWKYNEYLYVGTMQYDNSRRYALTWRLDPSMLFTDKDIRLQIKYI